MVSNIRRTLLACLQVYKQWGYSKSCTVKFHLPFPSQVFFCGIVLDTSYGYEFGPDQLAPKDLNPSGFTKYRDDFPNFWWFAIGKQQWGVIRNSSYSTSWVQSITFPIRFKLAYIAIANAYDVDRTGDHKAEFGCHAFNLTTSGLSYCYHGSAGGDCSDTATYIAIGQAQQWGYAGNSGGSVDVTFPVSFTKTVYQIQLTYNSDSYENPTYAIKDTKSFRYWSKYGGDKLWLAIGAQQWGRSTAATLNFSLPFQKFYCITTAQESWGSATFDNTSWITRTNISVTWPTYQGTNINYIAVGMQQCFKRCAFGKAQALPMDSHQKPAQPLPLS